MGMSDYDISSSIATIVSQRLVRKICTKCAKKREFTDQEKNIIKTISQKYDIDLSLEGKYTYDPVGCSHCNNSGFYDRIGVFEILNLDEELKELIVKGESSLDIRNKALKLGYEPLVLDALRKVINGTTTLAEINKKLIIF